MSWQIADIPDIPQIICVLRQLLIYLSASAPFLHPITYKLLSCLPFLCLWRNVHQALSQWGSSQHWQIGENVAPAGKTTDSWWNNLMAANYVLCKTSLFLWSLFSRPPYLNPVKSWRIQNRFMYLQKKSSGNVLSRPPLVLSIHHKVKMYDLSKAVSQLWSDQFWINYW